MEKFIRIGVDLAKNYFQVHALTSEGGPALTRKLTRLKMREFFSGIGPLPCWHGGLRFIPLLGARACGHGP